MEALARVRVKRRDPTTGEERVQELRKVPADSRVTAEKLITIVGDAVWKWARAQNEHGHRPKGILERAWMEIDRIPANTSGCKMWKNSHKPGFPFRPVCYSKTPQTCTLGNTPNKISRLELHEGLREVLGLSLAWCHVDLLIRVMNQRAAPLAKVASMQSIARETFIGSLWPRVSKLAFDHCMEHGQDAMLNARSIQDALTLGDDRAELDGFDVESKVHDDFENADALESKTSIIDVDDL